MPGPPQAGIRGFSRAAHGFPDCGANKSKPGAKLSKTGTNLSKKRHE